MGLGLFAGCGLGLDPHVQVICKTGSWPWGPPKGLLQVCVRAAVPMNQALEAEEVCPAYQMWAGMQRARLAGGIVGKWGMRPYARGY